MYSLSVLLRIFPFIFSHSVLVPFYATFIPMSGTCIAKPSKSLAFTRITSLLIGVAARIAQRKSPDVKDCQGIVREFYLEVLYESWMSLCLYSCLLFSLCSVASQFKTSITVFLKAGASSRVCTIFSNFVGSNH